MPFCRKSEPYVERHLEAVPVRKCERPRSKTHCGWLWDDGVVADVDHIDDDLIDVDVGDGDELLDHSVLHKAWGIYRATGDDKVVIAGN